MADILDSASDLVSHFEDSPWWNISRQMNGPELRDRFNITIQPKLDTNKDGHLSKSEIAAGLDTFTDKRDADAVRLLNDFYSFLLDFRSDMTPPYFNALHGEGLGRFAEFDKIMKRTNQQVADATTYLSTNFKAFDKNNDCVISETEMQAKAKNGTEREREYASFLLKDFWSIKSLSPCKDAPVSGLSLAGLAELKQRRTPASGFAATTSVPETPSEVALIGSLAEEVPTFPDEPVERPRARRHRHYVQSTREPRIVPPRLSIFESTAQAEARVQEENERYNPYWSRVPE